MPRFFIEEELADGRLVQLFDVPLTLVSAYHFVTPDNRALRPVVAAFRDWLRQEARCAAPATRVRIAG